MLRSHRLLFQHNGLQVVHLKVLAIGVSRCSYEYARLPSAARLTICIYIKRNKSCMPYYDVANLVSVTKMNMIDEMPCGYGTLRTTTTVRVWYIVSHRATQRFQLLSKSPADLDRD